MSFATPLFLWYFLPAVLVAVLVTPRTWRNGVVAVASLVFYAVGGGATTFLLLACIIVNFTIGLYLEPDGWGMAQEQRKALLIGAIIIDVGVLFVWKYAGFVTSQVDGFVHLFGG